MDGVEPFEVELLSDVEGSDGRRDKDGQPLRHALEPPEDAWMRDIWSVPNRAVIMSYFCVGFSMRFLTSPLSYYMVHDLGQWQVMTFGGKFATGVLLPLVLRVSQIVS